MTKKEKCRFNNCCVKKSAAILRGEKVQECTTDDTFDGCTQYTNP